MTCDWVWHGFGTTFCGTTIVDTWVVMAVLVILGFIAVHRPSIEHPRGLQNIYEMFLEFVRAFVGLVENETPRLRFLLTFLTTLVMFLFLSNLFGLLPLMKSPTNTLNTNFGLAVLVFILVQSLGFAEKGLHYFKRFTHPGGVLGIAMSPITVIEEFSKPLTLSMRLFGNIFAGELLIATLLKLLPLRWYYFLAVWFHVGWLMFSIFIAAVQAFIFMVLSRAYVEQAMAPEQEHG